MAPRFKSSDFSPARRLVLLLAGVAIALLVGLDFLVGHHPYFGIDGTPGFAAWYGFASAIVALALALGWARIAGRKAERADD